MKALEGRKKLSGLHNGRQDGTKIEGGDQEECQRSIGLIRNIVPVIDGDIQPLEDPPEGTRDYEEHDVAPAHTLKQGCSVTSNGQGIYCQDVSEPEWEESVRRERLDTKP